jgi:hypothetical protein
MISEQATAVSEYGESATSITRRRVTREDVPIELNIAGESTML